MLIVHNKACNMTSLGIETSGRRLRSSLTFCLDHSLDRHNFELLFQVFNTLSAISCRFLAFQTKRELLSQVAILACICNAIRQGSMGNRLLQITVLASTYVSARLKSAQNLPRFIKFWDKFRHNSRTWLIFG